MISPGISQKTSKWTPFALDLRPLVDDGEDEEAEDDDGEADLQRQAHPLAARGLGPEFAPASPSRWRSGCCFSTPPNHRDRPRNPAPAPGSGIVGRWASSSCWRCCASGCRRPGPRVRLGSGDDAAITVPGGATATSVDALVEGVHFRRETASLRQIGRKAISTALSDLAAMGAEPGEAYVVLGAPEDLGEAELLELGEGLAAVAAETGTTIAGGDLTRAPVLSLAVTVVGHAPRRRGLRHPRRRPPRRRAGRDRRARRRRGGTAAARGPSLADAPRRRRALRRHGRRAPPAPARPDPAPRRGPGPRRGRRHGDDRRLRRARRRRDHVATRERRAPRDRRRRAADRRRASRELAAAAGRDPLELAVSGGEDYELLAALPPDASRCRPRGARRVRVCR